MSSTMEDAWEKMQISRINENDLRRATSKIDDKYVRFFGVTASPASSLCAENEEAQSYRLEADSSRVK